MKSNPESKTPPAMGYLPSAICHRRSFLALALLATLHLQLAPGRAAPLGTAFTYQGRLNAGGTAASGLYDFNFALFNAASGGGQVGPTLVTNGVAVSNGLFTVTLDFGSGVFAGDARWLVVIVGTNGAPVLNMLHPRQSLTPAPHALYAPSAGTAALAHTVAAGAVTSAALADHAVSSAKIADGSIAAADVAPNTFWKLGGNSGSTAGTHFLGTTDDQPLEFKVNNQRVLRLELNGESPNTIGGNRRNWVAPTVHGATIGGGGSSLRTNAVAAAYGTVAGGAGNRMATDASYSTISGGDENSIGTNSFHSSIGGGSQNTIAEDASVGTIAGGYENSIDSSSTAGTIGGGSHNSIAQATMHATIAGGYDNAVAVNSHYTVIGGGYGNSAGVGSRYSLAGGGFGNAVASGAYYAVCVGGTSNRVSGNGAFIGGGGYDGSSFLGNTASGAGSVVMGGTQNLASGSRGSVGGGHNNAATNWYATVPGGAWNLAGGQSSFAAGQTAKARHDGAFVWGDTSTLSDLASTNANSVTMRAAGGYRLFSNNGTSAGVYLAPGGGSWTAMSDRNAKENLAPVDPQDVLEKIAALPVATWNYTSQDASIRHIGPMAQDFKAAFNVGESDTGITTIDADGVALAAIQGLNHKLEAQRAENAELKRRLAELERLVRTLNRTP